jgi:hypothetical protein
MKPKSLKSKFLSLSFLADGVTLLAVCGLLAAYDYQAFRRAMATDAQTYANIVANNCTAALSFNDDKDASQTLSSLRFQSHIVAARVFDASGNILTTYYRDQPVALAAWDKAAGTEPSFGHDRLDVWSAVRLNGQSIGEVYVAWDLQALHDRVRSELYVYSSSASSPLPASCAADNTSSSAIAVSFLSVAPSSSPGRSRARPQPQGHPSVYLRLGGRPARQQPRWPL